MTASVDLSIIIISWNVADLLAQCLDSIYHSPICILGADGSTHGEGLTTEVLVIDSASADSSVTLLQNDYPWVHLFACSENIGFVKGNNLGLSHARGRYLFLLNPDTKILDDAIPCLAHQLESDHTIGAVGPHTLNGDGTHQSTRRRFPTLITGIFESTWFEPYAPPILIQRYKVQDQPDNAVYDVDWVQGSALMVRREVYENIGGLDERYIMYTEEMDWCKRLKLMNWRVVYVGTAKIIHYGGQSSSQVKARAMIHFQHSKLRYFQKYHGKESALVLRFILVINYSWQWIVEGTKWLMGHKRSLRQERLAAYQRVLRSLTYAGESVIRK